MSRAEMTPGNLIHQFYGYLFIHKRIYILLLAVALAGCGKTSAEQAPVPTATQKSAEQNPRASVEKAGASHPVTVEKPPFNKVLVVLIDALRADKLGCYGFNEPTSPAIDQLARESILFENVHSASPWTAPSFGTLFTGVSPTVHGAGKMLGKNSKSGKSVHGVTVGGIRKDLPTLAELMPEKMKTAAVVNNSFVCKELGYARGFDDFDFQIARLTSYRTADQVTDAAIKWLAQNRNNSFFYFLHYFDPHIQYAPPKKYLPIFAPNKPPRIAYPFIDHASARDGSLNPSKAEKAFIRGLYHGEVRFVDDEFNRLVAFMTREGLMDDTWIIILSDHGEELFEHGSFDHGHRYEEEVTRVPWIIRPPGGKWHAGLRVSANVSHVDIFATLLDLANVSLPAHSEGESVLPMLDQKENGSRTSYMEFNLFNGQQAALFDGRYKLIYDIRRESAFVYDLLNDPAEQKKLNDANDQFAKLLEQLKRKQAKLKTISSGKEENSAVLSDESRDALKSLGYIK
ncbi:MAG: sulfatase [Deltaproteobacteria bacterium]|nr:sulfatase [Deltaproteobacteria bacterium]